MSFENQITHALIPRIAVNRGNKVGINSLLVMGGVALLSILAQVSLPLPWTPVPITGQTFGVMFVSLLWGQKRGAAVLVAYLLLGGLGLPIFSRAQSGLIGPTQGYLWGMLLASMVLGYLTDKGMTSTFLKSYLCCVLGSAIIFTCGLWGLKNFVPNNLLLAAGFLPFIPGDLIKNLLAALLVSKLNRK